ncbi:MAG: type 4a pilus biogenesis protein PilO [Candidatus Omnitrophota bacterium]
MLKNISKREKIILTICALLILAYFLFNFVFEPIKRKIDDLNNEILTKELKLKKNYKVLNLKDVQEVEYKKYSDIMLQKDSDEQEMSSLLSEIESVSAGIDMRVSDMKPLRVKVMDFYKKFSVELEAEGLLDDITRFIHTIQNKPYLLEIERLRLERRSMRTDKLKAFMLINRIRIP